MLEFCIRPDGKKCRIETAYVSATALSDEQIKSEAFAWDFTGLSVTKTEGCK